MIMINVIIFFLWSYSHIAQIMVRDPIKSWICIVILNVMFVRKWPKLILKIIRVSITYVILVSNLICLVRMCVLVCWIQIEQKFSLARSSGLHLHFHFLFKAVKTALKSAHFLGVSETSVWSSSGCPGNKAFYLLWSSVLINIAMAVESPMSTLTCLIMQLCSGKTYDVGWHLNVPDK